jgi:uncharacterized protein (DUF1499 family)
MYSLSIKELKEKTGMNICRGNCIFFLVLSVFTSGCAGSKPDGDANVRESLPVCSNRPNCVSSDAKDSNQFIKPFRLTGDPVAGWQALQIVVGNLPRTKIVTVTDHYIHAECKSRLFRFIDDLELLLDSTTGNISIRSASRIGYSDFGVNRRRVESLRQTLIESGLIHKDLDTGNFMK